MPGRRCFAPPNARGSPWTTSSAIRPPGPSLRGLSLLFAIALLCAGQSSTLTGTLAGQIVMEGFVRLRLAPWLRRLITRGLAIIPAVTVAALYGESGTARLLVLSQVVLSLQLPFAVYPLVRFTGDRARWGRSPTARCWRGRRGSSAAR